MKIAAFISMCENISHKWCIKKKKEKYCEKSLKNNFNNFWKINLKFIYVDLRLKPLLKSSVQKMLIISF